MTSPAEKREQILQAAVDIIIENGLESFSIRRLCSRSNLSIGVVYHHFSDKDAIIHAVLNQYGFGLLDWVAREVDSVQGDREKLKTKMKNGFNVYKKNASLVVIIANYLARSFYSAKEKEVTAGLLRKYRSTLLKIIHDGIASGSFRAADPQALAATILGATLGVGMQAAVDDTLNTDAISDVMIDMVLSAICGNPEK